MDRAGRSPRRRRTQPAPNSGTVTLLFTDIVASSLLLQDLGDDRAHRLRRAHFRLLRGALSRHNGREVKSLGDGLMAVFHSAVDAVGCAIEMQQRVSAESSKRGGVPVELRIGLHAGEPVEEERDYFGAPVVLAKRLCDSAYGGGIIASEVVRALVGTRNGFQWEDFQWLALKDTSVPIATYSVVWDSSSGSDQFLDTGHGPEGVDSTIRRFLSGNAASFWDSSGSAFWDSSGSAFWRGMSSLVPPSCLVKTRMRRQARLENRPVRARVERRPGGASHSMI